MNISFTPVFPELATKEKVYINGREIGSVFSYHSDYSGHRYQAQLSIPTVGANIHPGGFGETKEQAIEDAFKNAHTMLVEFTAWLNNVEVTL
jgi:hypothetical protein